MNTKEYFSGNIDDQDPNQIGLVINRREYIDYWIILCPFLREYFYLGAFNVNNVGKESSTYFFESLELGKKEVKY